MGIAFLAGSCVALYAAVKFSPKQEGWDFFKHGL